MVLVVVVVVVLVVVVVVVLVVVGGVVVFEEIVISFSFDCIPSSFTSNFISLFSLPCLSSPPSSFVAVIPRGDTH